MDILRRLTWKHWFGALALVLILLYPLAGASRYMLHLGGLFFIWCVVASYWNLLNGYTGITSLGNVGFMAIGGYTSAILAKSLGVSPWLAVPAAGLFTMVVVTTLVGLPTLRLKGIYVALLTLIFADSLPSVISQLREISGGGMGLHSIPLFLPDMQKMEGYYIGFVFFIIAQFVLYRVIHSNTGTAFMALRDSEDLAQSLGVNFFRERIKVFALSSLMTGAAGGFYVHTLGDISPAMLGIEQFLLTITMWELGGIGTFFGPIIGSAIIVFGSEFLRLAGTLRLALLGILICAIVLFWPGGIMEGVVRIEGWIQSRRQRRRPAEIEPAG
jgi:branched-chain amino acid transport system permease protein